jgi:hypothetical protein
VYFQRYGFGRLAVIYDVGLVRKAEDATSLRSFISRGLESWRAWSTRPTLGVKKRGCANILDWQDGLTENDGLTKNTTEFASLLEQLGFFVSMEVVQSRGNGYNGLYVVPGHETRKIILRGCRAGPVMREVRK